MVIESVPKFAGGRKDEPKERPQNFQQELALLAAEEKRAVLSVARAGRLLGKSKDTIYRWLEEGKLSGRKVGGRWIIYHDSVEAAWEAGLVERE